MNEESRPQTNVSGNPPVTPCPAYEFYSTAHPDASAWLRHRYSELIRRAVLSGFDPDRGPQTIVGYLNRGLPLENDAENWYCDRCSEHCPEAIHAVMYRVRPFLIAAGGFCDRCQALELPR